jgi:hypothetical protein
VSSVKIVLRLEDEGNLVEETIMRESVAFGGELTHPVPELKGGMVRLARSRTDDARWQGIGHVRMPWRLQLRDLLQRQAGSVTLVNLGFPLQLLHENGMRSVMKAFQPLHSIKRMLGELRLECLNFLSLELLDSLRDRIDEGGSTGYGIVPFRPSERSDNEGGMTVDEETRNEVGTLDEVPIALQYPVTREFD